MPQQKVVDDFVADDFTPDVKPAGSSKPAFKPPTLDQIRASQASKYPMPSETAGGGFQGQIKEAGWWDRVKGGLAEGLEAARAPFMHPIDTGVSIVDSLTQDPADIMLNIGESVVRGREAGKDLRGASGVAAQAGTAARALTSTIPVLGPMIEDIGSRLGEDPASGAGFVAGAVGVPAAVSGGVGLARGAAFPELTVRPTQAQLDALQYISTKGIRNPSKWDNASHGVEVQQMLQQSMLENGFKIDAKGNWITADGAEAIPSHGLVGRMIDKSQAKSRITDLEGPVRTGSKRALTAADTMVDIAGRPLNKTLEVYGSHPIQSNIKVAAQLRSMARDNMDPQIRSSLLKMADKVQNEGVTVAKLNDIKVNANKEIRNVLSGSPGADIAGTAQTAYAYRLLGDAIREHLYPELKAMGAPDLIEFGRREAMAIQARDGIYADYAEANPAQAGSGLTSYLDFIETDGLPITTNQIMQRTLRSVTRQGSRKGANDLNSFNRTFNTALGNPGKGFQMETVHTRSPGAEELGHPGPFPVPSMDQVIDVTPAKPGTAPQFFTRRGETETPRQTISSRAAQQAPVDRELARQAERIRISEELLRKRLADEAAVRQMRDELAAQPSPAPTATELPRSPSGEIIPPITNPGVTTNILRDELGNVRSAPDAQGPIVPGPEFRDPMSGAQSPSGILRQRMMDDQRSALWGAPESSPSLADAAILEEGARKLGVPNASHLTGAQREAILAQPRPSPPLSQAPSGPEQAGPVQPDLYGVQSGNVLKPGEAPPIGSGHQPVEGVPPRLFGLNQTPFTKEWDFTKPDTFMLSDLEMMAHERAVALGHSPEAYGAQQAGQAGRIFPKEPLNAPEGTGSSSNMSDLQRLEIEKDLMEIRAEIARRKGSRL